MGSILALALKDLRILLRIRSGVFFSFVWPILVSVLFGYAMSGQGAARAALRVIVVDQDDTEASRAFVARLEQSGDFVVERGGRAEADERVRRGQRSAFVVIKPGFGDASQQLFSGAPRQVEIGYDPARQHESSMIEGLLMKHAMQDVRRQFAGAAAWQPLRVTKTQVARQQTGPSSGFDVTFPQGIVWGIIGCVMTFAVSLVSERVHGTFVRLQMAPLTRAQILAGKALACFIAIVAIQIVLFVVGRVLFGVTPSSVPLLILACLSAAIGFVGFMMMVASFGKTEQAVSGAGWAMLMPMAMFGGAMIPAFIMPAWMRSVGNASPVKWAILGVEGAVWRQFTLAEMMLPCAILLGFGAVCFAIGTRGLRGA